MAAMPVSAVRMRMTCSTGVMNTFPSPQRPVRAARNTTPSASAICSSGSTTYTLKRGKKSTR